MTEWWTYRLSDFLLFSADTYYRLFELYNQSIWPVHLLLIVVSIAVVFFIIRPKPWAARALLFFLSASWLWIAWGYHVAHFASINWAATYYAAGFGVEGLLLLLVGVFNKKLYLSVVTNLGSRVGIGLVSFSLFIQPLIGPLSGRPWAQLELIGLAPDPTAILTLGAILLAGKSRWILLPIPLTWCLISSATLWTMGMFDYFLMPVAALLTLVVAGKSTFVRPAK